MADHLRKYEQLYVPFASISASSSISLNDPASFTLTPQRMRMITQAFSETLDNGLKKPGQVVVSLTALVMPRIYPPFYCVSPANDPDFRLWLANGRRDRRLSRSRSRCVITFHAVARAA